MKLAVVTLLSSIIMAGGFTSSKAPHIEIENIKCSKVLKNRYYDVCYSYERKTPVAVLFSPSKASIERKKGRSCSFTVDYRIPIKYRSYSRYYSKSGYDRGHMAPYSLLDGTYYSSRESCRMSNIFPQSPKINRGIWRKVESFEELMASLFGNVEIATGICGEKGRIRGDVKIPKYIYSVVYVPKAKIKFFFLVENAFRRYDLGDAVTDAEGVNLACGVNIELK